MTYDIESYLVYSVNALLDRAMPHVGDVEAWKRWDAAKAAVGSYGRYLKDNPFNPVVAEAYARGDYALFADQLERGDEENRKRKGWTKKQVREAIPIIRTMTETVWTDG